MKSMLVLIVDDDDDDPHLPLWSASPPVRRQRGRRERLSRLHHGSPGGPQDENYRHPPHPHTHALHSYGPAVPPHPPTGTDEPRAFHPPALSPRLLHPQQQGTVVMDLHEQVGRRLCGGDGYQNCIRSVCGAVSCANKSCVCVVASSGYSPRLVHRVSGGSPRPPASSLYGTAHPRVLLSAAGARLLSGLQQPAALPRLPTSGTCACVC